LGGRLVVKRNPMFEVCICFHLGIRQAG